MGAAWDVRGDGRTALRSSYALNYDFPGGAYQQAAANVNPFNRNVSINGNIPFANPYSLVASGAPEHPVPIPAPSNAVFPSLAPYSSIEPDTNSIRVQSWNATIEQQIGADWQVAASYLGSHIDRIWGRKQINEGTFLGLGPCTLNGVNYATCTTRANLQARRALTLEDPVTAGFYSTVYTFTDIGLQDYRGLKLSFRRRSANGLTVSGNYTISHCTTDSPYGGRFVSDFEYTNPDDPTYDKGNCPFNRTHIVAFTLGYQTPRFDNTALRVVASDWRVSGVLNGQSGNWLTVTTGVDPAGTGIGGQRVNQVSDDVYGPQTKQPDAIVGYLDRAAFAVPGAGTYGDHEARSITGPGYWNVDLALARLLPVGDQRTFEIRIETFNLFNNFNWGDPVTNLDSPQFGRITTQNGSPRIMQFALKYGF